MRKHAFRQRQIQSASFLVSTYVLVASVTMSQGRFHLEIARVPHKCARGEIAPRIFARSQDDAAACCMNSSHEKPFQFLACFCTSCSGFCAASRSRAPGYTLCKQLPGAKSFCVVTTYANLHILDVIRNRARATGRDLSNC